MKTTPAGVTVQQMMASAPPSRMRVSCGSMSVSAGAKVSWRHRGRDAADLLHLDRRAWPKPLLSAISATS